MVADTRAVSGQHLTRCSNNLTAAAILFDMKNGWTYTGKNAKNVTPSEQASKPRNVGRRDPCGTRETGQQKTRPINKTERKQRQERYLLQKNAAST